MPSMKAIYTKAGAQDLVDLTVYRLQFNEASVVEKLLDKIDGEVKRLEKNPNIGSWLKNRIEKETDYRYIVCDKYLIFYEIGNDEVSITRILDGRQNWQNALLGG